MALARVPSLAAILLGLLSTPALGTVLCDRDEMDLCTDEVDNLGAPIEAQLTLTSAAVPVGAGSKVAAAAALLATAAALLPSAAAAERYATFAPQANDECVMDLK